MSRRRLGDGLLILMVAVSGVAGLVHEVAWARALGQVIGTSLQSLAAVLVSFLGGLGLGAAIGARTAGRSASPLRAYAFLELIIGLYGAIAPSVAAAVSWILEAIGPGMAAGLPLSTLRFSLAMAALSAPTVAMGATFPYLVRAATERGFASETAVAVLYGANTLGAAGGAFAGSFLLLPLLGTRLTFAAAAGMNLLAGCAALALRQRPSIAEGVPPEEPPPRPPLAARHLPLVCAVVSGAVGAILQVGWTRVTALAFGSTLYALGLTLTVYILGLGLGPFCVRRRLLQPGAAPGLAAAAQGLLGVSSLLIVPALGFLPVVAALLSSRLGADPRTLISAQFLLIAGLLLLPTVAQGASFPCLAIMARDLGARPDRAAGAVYAASTWGSVGGVLLAGFVALPELGTRRGLGLASCGACLLSALLLVARPWLTIAESPRRRAAVILPAALLILGAPLFAAALPAWDPSLLSGGGFLYGPVYRAAFGTRGQVREAMRRRGEILLQRDGGEGLVTVRRSPAGILSLQINGKTEASTGGDMANQLLAGHLPLWLHPDPSKVLVIGLASGITLGGVSRHPVETMRAMEIAPAVLDAARLFAADNGNVLEDPRVTIILDDARGQLLARLAHYDVVTSQPSNPWVVGVPNLFTVEFYRLVRSRLRPGGLFCQWVQAYRLPPGDFRGIVRSFLEVFPHATLWEESGGSGDYYLVGGDRPLRIDRNHLRATWAPSVWEDLKRAGVDGPADLLARYVSGPRGLLAFSAGSRRHTDDDLYLEWSAPLALFSDTHLDQVTALRRFREPVLEILPEGLARSDPELLAALRDRIRAREARIEIVESLKEADLWSLQDPFLAGGIEFLRSGLWTEAVSALSRAAASHPASGTAHFLLGEAYRAAGLDEAAAVAYREAVRRDPSIAPAWNALGRHLAARDLLEAARAAFEQALQADPSLAAARNNLGTIFLRTGRLREAEGCFREAAQADGGLAPARANLGLVLKRRGDLAAAESHYRAALDLDPLNLDARFNLAELLRTSGRQEEARQELSRILRVDPGDADALAALDEMRAPAGP
jgi:spermidine synthase